MVRAGVFGGRAYGAAPSSFGYPGTNPAFGRYWGRRRFKGKNNYKNKFTTKHTYGPAPKGAEAKAYDAYDGQTFAFGTSNVPLYNVLNAVTQGTDYKNRVGSRIKMKSIDIHIWPYYNPAGNQTVGAIYRIMLVYDSQPNGANPSASDLLKSTAGTTTAASPVNLDNRDRFLVLRDYYLVERTAANAGGGAGVQPSTISSGATAGQPDCIHWYVKLKHLETIYKASAGAITDISSGSLLIVTVTQGAAAGWDLSVSSRLRFYD